MREPVSERWIRSQRASVVEIGDDIVLISRDGTVHRVAGDSAELARAVLDHLGTPRREADVIAHVEALAGEPLGERVAVVRQLLTLLAETGSVTHARDPQPRPGCNIVVAVCGAIAASAAPALVAALQRRGHTVEVAVTPTAARFVALDALSAIVQREPQTSMWPRAPHVPVPHVALAAWADLVLVYPATATTIARLAHGDFSELVAATALTTRAPVVLVPSMNPDMLAAPAVERNLALLRGDGFAIIRGVPAQEVADPPSLRDAQAGAAPAPAEVAAAIDVLLAAEVLARRDAAALAASTWQAVYRGAASSPDLLPWASERCDDDIAAMLAAHAPGPPARVLDLGCGLGQVARHAAAAGHRVVATDIAAAALELARDRTPRDADIVWLRDDIGASALVGPFDVIVDRATLHTLSPLRALAWAASIRRLTASGSIVIVKAHREGVAGATIGCAPGRIAALLQGFTIISERETTLPGPRNRESIAAILIVLRRN